MARTTEAAVKLVLLLDYDHRNTPSLLPFIETASAMVDDAVLCSASATWAITSTRAELIERWLAAHFYKCSDQQLAEKKTADAYGKYTGKTDEGLRSTKYGQTAISLDPSGCLLEVASTQQAQMVWLGKPPSDQLDYDQRD